MKSRIAPLFTEQGGADSPQPVLAFLHFWVFVGRSFVRNRCPVRATALAYTTLLALVPLLAVSLGVSTSLLKRDQDQTRAMIEHLIGQVAPQLEQLPGTAQEKAEARQRVIEQIQSYIANIHSGALGVTGTVALVFVAIGLLSTIEASLNEIWGVLRGRSWLSRVIHYWTAITLGPLVILLALGTAVSGQFLDHAPGWLARLTLNVAPFLVLSVSFGLLYQLMPNTKVRWQAALVGGLVGALLWMLNSKFNVVFASRVVSASRIYGPLGVFPVFLIGIYVSWIILLFGAQVAYAFQNRHADLQEKRNDTVSPSGREFVALRLMLAVAQRFDRGLPPASAAELAGELGVSPRLVTRLVRPLRDQRLLVEVNAPGPACAPARPLDRIHLGDILNALRSEGDSGLPTRPGALRELVEQAVRKVWLAGDEVAQRVTLRELVDRAGSVEAPRAVGGGR